MKFLKALLRGAVKALKVSFLLLLIVVPIPIANLFGYKPRRDRRNLPTLVVKKEDEG